MIKILLVEDQVHLREMLQAQLEAHDFAVHAVPTRAAAAEKIAAVNYDVIILDLRLPDGNSIELFDRFGEKMSHRTIIVTANATIPSVVEAIKKGAFNYLEKPVDEDLLLAQVRKIIEWNQLKNNYHSIKSEVGSNYVFDDIVYASAQMQELISRGKVLAKTDNTILLQGETGAGKEVMAQSIHYYSLRKREVFLPVNCASIPGELFESELFGFEKGAFTGAVSNYSGRFIQADKGTLFLDEVGELPLTIQAKLLRILDEKIIYQLKSKKPQKVDVRLIAATNKDLAREVEVGNFRSDLYYRLKEATLRISPLRERTEDIMPLIRHFIRVYSHVHNKNVIKITREAENYFLSYTWKGNVRELKNTIKSIIPFKKNNTIDLEDFSYSVMEKKEIDEDRFPTLEDHEKRYIRKVLNATGSNISRSAEILGTNRPRLYRKIKFHNLDVDG